MTHRQRVSAALSHRPPDRVPIDLGGTSLTGMRPAAQRRLAELLGLAGSPIPVNNRFDERLMLWAGTDFRSVGHLVDLPSPHTRRISDTAHVNYWGVRYDRIDGEWQITDSPLANVTTIDDLRSFRWPDPTIPDKTLHEFAAAKALHDQNEYVVIAEHPICGVMELGCWLFGYNRYLEAIALEPDLIAAFSEKILEIQLKVIDQYYAAVGPYIDLTINGDDFGTQTGPFLSPEMFDTMIAPAFTARIARIKQLAPQARFWHHSCGSVFALLPNILRCGVDILNPIQTSAAQMDPAGLKAAFGDRLIFWGAMDVQQFLPHATPEQVREHTRHLIATLGKDGGYVMAGAHEILDDIPPENLGQLHVA